MPVILFLPQVKVATILKMLECQWMKLVVEIYYYKDAPECGFDEIDIEMLPGGTLVGAPPISPKRWDERWDRFDLSIN